MIIRPKKILLVCATILFVTFSYCLYIGFQVENSFFIKTLYILAFFIILYFVKNIFTKYKIEIKGNQLIIRTLALAGYRMAGGRWNYDTQEKTYDLKNIKSLRLEYNKHYQGSSGKAVGKGDLILVVTDTTEAAVSFRVGIFSKKKMENLFEKNLPGQFLKSNS